MIRLVLRLMMAGTAALTACVFAPDEGPISVTVMPRAAAARADDLGRADVEILLDDAAQLFRHDVTISATGGTFAGGPQMMVKAPANGRLLIPLRYGRVPGPVQITVNAGPQIAIDDTLELAEQPPELLVPRPPGHPLDATRGDEFSLRVDLLVNTPGARVSVGTRVWFSACCAGPSACAEPPISVDPLAIIDPQTDQVSVVVRPRALPMADMPGTIDGIIVAGLDGPPMCTAGALQVPVTVALPFDPFARPE